jgi:hypothetical protein
MIQSIGNIVLFIMGWALFVAGQAQNSIRSKTNGLPPGFAGLHQWLSFNVVNLAQRAFWSGLFYGFIVHATVARLEAAGFPITSYMAAGMGGWFANGALYQIFGLLGKREEVSDFAPPPNTQIAPPPITSNGPNPNLGAKQP